MDSGGKKLPIFFFLPKKGHRSGISCIFESVQDLVNGIQTKYEKTKNYVVVNCGDRANLYNCQVSEFWGWGLGNELPLPQYVNIYFGICFSQWLDKVAPIFLVKSQFVNQNLIYGWLYVFLFALFSFYCTQFHQKCSVKTNKPFWQSKELKIQFSNVRISRVFAHGYFPLQKTLNCRAPVLTKWFHLSLDEDVICCVHIFYLHCYVC